MLTAARRARTPLRDRREAAVAFVRSQRRDDGGFADRAGRSDLYYSVFGLECLAALDAPADAESIARYAARWTNDAAALAGLDFVHACCLARCMHLAGRFDAAPAAIAQIESFRAADGGFGRSPGDARGSAYGCILGLGAYQDLAALPPRVERIAACLASLRTADGGYANEPDQPVGLTPATAAALAVQVELGGPVDAGAVRWLLAQHTRGGGFQAMPAAPIPDLLSTATALHALGRIVEAAVPADGDLPDIAGELAALRRRCVEFVELCWTPPGGFVGHAFDDTLDCEYTFYGLLALGRLAEIEDGPA